MVAQVTFTPFHLGRELMFKLDTEDFEKSFRIIVNVVNGTAMAMNNCPFRDKKITLFDS